MQCINYILFYTSFTFKSYRHACRYVPKGCLRINDLYNSAELLYPLFDTLETKFFRLLSLLMIAITCKSYDKSIDVGDAPIKIELVIL